MATTTGTKSATRTRKAPALKSTAPAVTPDLASRPIHTGEPSLFDRILQDTRNSAQQQRDEERRAFQVRQVEIARTFRPEGEDKRTFIADLKPGTVAYKLAHGALDEFVEAEGFEKDGGKVGKTQAAILNAFAKLSPEDQLRTAAVNVGKSAVFLSLGEAYKQAKEA
jgi:hypothetical protein